MRLISIHQPAYMPWLGYFHKAMLSDVFVFLDTVQFEKNSFTNRNKILSKQGPIWLTVPVGIKGHTQKTIQDMEIAGSDVWKRKHLQTIIMNYSKTRFFNEYFPEIENSILKAGISFCDFVFTMTEYFFELLKTKTRFVRSSSIPVAGAKDELVRNICVYFEADVYFSGALGRDYLNQKGFEQKGIKVIYQDFVHPVYPQLSKEFHKGMGIIDVLMNVGATDTRKLILSVNTTRKELEECVYASK